MANTTRKHPDLFGLIFSSPCCGAYPGRDEDTGIPLCGDCGEPYDPETGEGGHSPECDCASCENDRALDEDADMREER